MEWEIITALGFMAVFVYARAITGTI